MKSLEEEIYTYKNKWFPKSRYECVYQAICLNSSATKYVTFIKKYEYVIVFQFIYCISKWEHKMRACLKNNYPTYIDTICSSSQLCPEGQWLIRK
jgi:hypothetical protein